MELFTEYSSFQNPGKVTVGDGRVLKVIGRGTVGLLMRLSGGKVVLKDVLHHPLQFRGVPRGVLRVLEHPHQPDFQRIPAAELHRLFLTAVPWIHLQEKKVIRVKLFK